MRIRRFAAILVGTMALLVARGAAASEATITVPDRTSVEGPLQDAKRVALLLADMGLSRLRLWTAAVAVSRGLVADANGPLDGCIAQAAVAWQSHELGGQDRFVEWEKLRRVVEDFGSETDASPRDVQTCRATYRRVTGEIAVQEQRVAVCGNAAVERHWMKRVLRLYEAYWTTFQPSTSTAGPPMER
jgi:hypothetical protein